MKMENHQSIMGVRTSCSYSNSLLVVSDDINNNHGRSKAQMSLKKIIDIISSGSSEKEKKFEDKEKRGLGIDLNLRLCCFGNDDDGFSSDCSGVIGGGERGLDYVNNGENNVEFTSGSNSVENCDVECDLKGVVDVIEVREEEEERRELSEVTDLETPEIEEKEDGVMEEVVVEMRETKKNGEKGYLDLLVEAARFISGNFADETDEEEEEKRKSLDDEVIETKRNKSKRNKDECLMTEVYEDFEDISPVVKSKRGRNQVLPYRYRDSVLDPWKSTKQPRSSSLKRVSERNRN